MVSQAPNDFPDPVQIQGIWETFTGASRPVSQDQDSADLSLPDILQAADPYSDATLLTMEKGTPIKLGTEEYPYKAFDCVLFGRDIEERSTLEAAGLSSTHLDTSDAHTILPTYAHYISARVNISFQDTIVAHKAQWIISPLSGQPVHSVESYLFLHDGLIVVFNRYVDAGRIFFLVTTSGQGERIAFVFPDVSVVVKAKPVSHGWANPTRLMAAFKLHIASHSTAVQRRMDWAKGKSAVKTCAVACNASIGHYYWNNVSGVQRLLDSGSYDNVDHLIVGPINFMEFSRAYSDLPKGSYEVVNSMAEVVARSYERDYLYFYHTDRCAREAQARRYITLAHDVLGPEKTGQIAEALPADALKIWVTLRQGRRSWINQNEGIAHITRKLLEDFPKLIVVFDGFTLPSPTLPPQNLDDPAWRGLDKVIEREKALAAEVAELLPPEVQTQNCIGVTPEEKIVTLKHIDFFIAPFGSGAIWTSWIGNKPGIYHINSNATEAFKMIVNYRENPVHNKYVPAEFIENADDSGQIHVSYRMDWRGVYIEICDLLTRHGIGQK